MNRNIFKLLFFYLLIVIELQKFSILALKCRMEDEPSEDELRKVIHTCVKKVIGNQNNFNGDTGSASNGNNPSWTNSNNNNHKNYDGFDNEDNNRIKNREHLQMRPAYHKMFKKNSQIYFDTNYDQYNDNNNNNNNRQQQQHQQQLQQQYNNNYNQKYGNGMNMDYGYGGSPLQYDTNMGNSDSNSGNNNNNNYDNQNNNNDMNHDFNGNSYGYGNNGQIGQSSYNNNNNNNNNWNYRHNNTEKFNIKPQDKQKQHEGACIVHCFFGELKMLNNDDFPDKRKVIQVLTKDVKNNDLREFYTESVKECFHLIEVEQKTKDKCEFAKILINCMTDYARANCDDWDESTIIF